MHDTIVTAPGSLGDVNPLLGIARSLQSLGRNVLFCAAEPYLHLAERAGLQVHPLTSTERFNQMVANPNLWHPRHGLRVIFDSLLGESLVNHYRWLEQHAIPGKTLLVGHLLDFAGRIYRDRHPQTQLASVALQPSVLRSLIQPPRLSGFGWERRLPKSLRRLGYWCGDRFIDSLAGKHINGLRRQVGMAPVKRIIKDWWFSPDLMLAMFPDWFSIPHQDLPRQAATIGFPLTDSADIVDSAIDNELDQLLRSFHGRRPIVFIPGTAHHHCKSFLTIARDACQQLGLPAILISTKAEQVPDNLPQGIVTAKYLPFTKLLPHCDGIVHHGGVGTTSQALAAGVPQIVLPMAFDQFDNAQRVADLQCGSWLAMRKLTLDRLVAHLRSLPTASAQTAAVACRFTESRDASHRAAQRILSLSSHADRH